MEDALRAGKLFFTCGDITGVLILVLMEDALRGHKCSTGVQQLECLNPCSNGRCSASNTYSVQDFKSFNVLILVLMEDALRVHNQSRDNVLMSLS